MSLGQPLLIVLAALAAAVASVGNIGFGATFY